jgi:hypothetical protein
VGTAEGAAYGTTLYSGAGGRTATAADFERLDAELDPGHAEHDLKTLAQETWETARHSIPVYGMKRMSYTHDLMSGAVRSTATSASFNETFYGRLKLHGVAHIIVCEMYCKYYDWCLFGSYDQGLRQCSLGADNANYHAGVEGRRCDSCLSFAKSDPDAADGWDIQGFASVTSEYGVDPGRLSGLAAGFDARAGQTEGESEVVETSTSKPSCEDECKARPWCRFGTYQFTAGAQAAEAGGAAAAEAEADRVDHGGAGEAAAAHRNATCTLMDWTFLWRLRKCDHRQPCHTFAVQVGRLVGR